MPNEAIKKLQPFFDKKERLGHLLGIVSYDLETCAPDKAIEKQNELLSFYGAEYASISKDPEYIKLVKEAKELGNLNEAETLLIDDLLFDISIMEKIPIEKYIEWNLAISKCNEIWKKAKNASDWNMVLPYFKKVVAIKREQTALYHLPFHKTPYDSFLSEYEKGQTEEYVDSIFNPLKEFLINNLDKVLANQAKNPVPPLGFVSRDEQAHFSNDVMNLINYDLTRGVLRETEHPFTNDLSRDDIRITTHYHEDDWRRSLYSVIHEAGHAIQFQNWPDYQYDNHVNGRATSALCETHSRFYENIIGRNKNFTNLLLKLAQKNFGKDFLKMSEEDFYQSVNQVTRSLIRCDSDEYTYCLHIIIRYELEKDLINGVIEAEDLPSAWNKKYQDYLGITPPNDALGVLQDTHWYSGSFGYFPSYALGNLYGAQILHYMKKDLDFDGLLAKGDLAPILNWLKEKDFAFDYLDPKDWIIKVTGEAMNPQYFIDYLKEKFF